MQRVFRQSIRSAKVVPGLRQPVRILRTPVMMPKMAAVRFNSTNASQEKAEKNEEVKKEEQESKQQAKQNSEGESPGEQNGEKAAAEESGPSNELEELKSKLTKKDKELADMKNYYARAVADFRNLQDSTKKEVQKARDFALQKFAKELLESVDNFNLALSAVKEDTLESNNEVKNLYEGVAMTRDVFEKTLARHGIEKMDPVGKQFDPNHHEATFEVPQPDKEPGTVFHVQQTGYTLNSRVLRPAKVGLVKGEN